MSKFFFFKTILVQIHLWVSEGENNEELGTKSLRARSQIPSYGLTGHTPGWFGALKLPGTAV